MEIHVLSGPSLFHDQESLLMTIMLVGLSKLAVYIIGYPARLFPPSCALHMLSLRWSFEAIALILLALTDRRPNHLTFLNSFSLPTSENLSILGFLKLQAPRAAIRSLFTDGRVGEYV